MTGIDDPYEVPEAPEVHLKSGAQSPDTLADQVIGYLESTGIITNNS